MQTTLIPPPFQHIAALVIFTLGIFLIAAHTMFATVAAERSTLTPRARRLAPILLAAYLAGWFGLALLAIDAGNLPMAREKVRAVAAALVLAGPFIAALGL